MGHLSKGEQEIRPEAMGGEDKGGGKACNRIKTYLTGAKEDERKIDCSHSSSVSWDMEKGEGRRGWMDWTD